MVRKNTQLSGMEPAPVQEMKPSNIDAAFDKAPQGAGLLRLRYRGPLARHKRLWLRVGERRQGRDWLAVHDVPMTSAGGEAIVTVAFEPGEPVEGACFAFFTHKDGATDVEAWDNAGRPFGYYQLDAETGRIEAR